MADTLTGTAPVAVLEGPMRRKARRLPAPPPAVHGPGAESPIGEARAGNLDPGFPYVKAHRAEIAPVAPMPVTDSDSDGLAGPGGVPRGGRAGRRHQALGSGPRGCPGRNVARRELRVVHGTFRRRIRTPRPRPAAPIGHPAFERTGTTHGVTCLTAGW